VHSRSSVAETCRRFDPAERDLRQFFREHLQSFASKKQFTVRDQEFSLSGFRLHGGITEQNGLIYGAAYREVISERLGRFLPNLRGRLTDHERGPFFYVAFVESPFLDERVNNERTDFSISREPAGRDIATFSTFACVRTVNRRLYGLR
jgi:hypothetical protein